MFYVDSAVASPTALFEQNTSTKLELPLTLCASTSACAPPAGIPCQVRSLWSTELARSWTACRHLPRLSFCHQTTLPEWAVTSAGVMSFLVWSHSKESFGNKVCKELHTHTCLPEQQGQPLLLIVRQAGRARHLCNCPCGHLRHIQLTGLLLRRAVLWGCIRSLAFSS